MLIFFFILKGMLLRKEARRGTEAQAWDCKRDRLWVQVPLEEMKFIFITQYAIASRIQRKIGK